MWRSAGNIASGVQQGAVVYCAFEGQTRIQARVEAFRQSFPIETDEPVPFYLQPVTLDLVADRGSGRDPGSIQLRR